MRAEFTEKYIYISFEAHVPPNKLGGGIEITATFNPRFEKEDLSPDPLDAFKPIKSIP